MRDRGYSFVEMAIILMLVTSTGLMGITYLSESRSRYELKMAAQLLVSELSHGKAHVVTRNECLTVFVREDRRAFGLATSGTVPNVWRVLPGRVRFSRIPRSPVVLYSRGFVAPGGTFWLSNRTELLKVIIPPAGRIRWEYAD